MLLSQNAQVQDVTEGRLVLGFSNPGARENFMSSGTQDLLIDSLIEVIGVELAVEAIVTASKDNAPAQRPAGRSPEPPVARESQSEPRSSRPQPSVASAASPPERDDEPEIAVDDSELKDAGQAAAELLVTELGATIIDTTDEHDNPS